MIPVYLNNRDWLTPLVGMVNYLRQLPVEIIVIDNASTYPPLLDWYSQTDVRIIRSSNGGAVGPWAKKIVPIGEDHIKRYGHPWYVTSDSDLDLSGVPLDVLDVLIEGKRKYPWAVKVGLSLEYEDLPEGFLDRNFIVQWESGFWRNRLDDKFWKAALGHTFALYDASTPYDVAKTCSPAVRTDRPYTARHLPWYYTKENWDEEAEYYVGHVEIESSLRNPFNPRPLRPWAVERMKWKTTGFPESSSR